MDAGRFADEPWQFQWACAVVFLLGRFKQTIMTSLYDVMRISCAVKGGNYKGRAQLNLGAVVTVIWVFWYKAFGFVSKPQTLYLGCLGASWGGSITRMDSVTYLSICMHPDLSGGLSVSVTLVVWWQPGRSLPPPLNLVSSKAWITTLQ